MKKRIISITLLGIIVTLTACSGFSPTTPTPHGDPLAPTTTPEIFIGLTQVIPARVQLNGITLAVQDAFLGACDLPDCSPAANGTRYLRVSLQALDLPADQFLDYKNLPQGIGVHHDNIGAFAPIDRAAYFPSTQKLALYFLVPESARVFGLLWPGIAEIPLTVVVESLTAQTTPNTGMPVFYGSVSMVLPLGLASGISGNQLSRSEEDSVAPYDATPGHVQIDLNGYLLQGKTHQPQVRIYPAQGYAEMYPGAFESMHRLNNILGNPGGPVSKDQLPQVPFFNAQQVFASHVQVIAFQNGKGVRFVTEYSQSPVSANNTDLFYQFIGVTSDGAYYIVATLPTSSPLLAETSDAGAVLTAVGIPYPDLSSPNADLQGYYYAISALLNSASPDSFSPTIGLLDALIQSLQITP